jgi:sugar/nucleoside kinase (ribokinase family)
MHDCNNKVKVLGCGSPIVDILVNVTDDFLAANVDGDKGGMELVDISVIDTLLDKISAEKSTAPGGSCANTIQALSVLGVKTGLLGKLGADDRGVFYSEDYCKKGGDTNQFKKNSNVRTGCCLSMVTPDSQRTMRTYLGAAATITVDDITEDDFDGYTHLHLEGYTLQYLSDVALKVLKLAKNKSLIISLDLSSFEVVRQFQGKIPELLKTYVDIVFCNEDEARQLCGSDDPEEFFKSVDDLCEVAVLKLGEAGSMIKFNGEVLKINANFATAIDTTGAGDLWQSGFLYGYLNSKKLTSNAIKRSGIFGSVLGAEIVQVMGASLSDEKWTEIKTNFENIIKED